MSNIMQEQEDERALGQDPVDLVLQRALAAKEVERILAIRNIDQVLGGGSWDEQRLEFRRLAKILHPDKGVVSSDDKHAALAMRFAIAAMHRAHRQRCSNALLECPLSRNPCI